MRLVGLLWVMKVIMTLFPSSDCATSGGRTELCRNCDRPMPTQPVEEDLFHLKHNDPCFDFKENDSVAEKRATVGRCNALVRLYLRSRLYDEGKASKCKDARQFNCFKHGSDFYTKFHCTVELPSKYWGFIGRQSEKRLSECVKEDFDWYLTRTKVYGAQHTVAETPKAPPQIQRKTKEEASTSAPKSHGSQSRRSQSPPAGGSASSRTTDRGRATTRQSSGLFGNFGKSRKAKSQSPTRPLLREFTGS